MPVYEEGVFEDGVFGEEAPPVTVTTRFRNPTNIVPGYPAPTLTRTMYVNGVETAATEDGDDLLVESAEGAALACLWVKENKVGEVVIKRDERLYEATAGAAPAFMFGGPLGFVALTDAETTPEPFRINPENDDVEIVQ